MKKQTIINATAILTLSSAMVFSLLTSCEGPQGIAGVDANESCKQCHNAKTVDAIAEEFQLSKHNYGVVAEEEAGNTGCTPCHASTAFRYVCENNIPATFTLNPTTNKYVNDYATIASAAYGELGCITCHANLHTAFDSTDLFPLTNVAAVSMTMWGGKKTIDLTQDGGIANLCVKCHQPRPLTASLKDGNVLDYEALAANPAGMFFEPGSANNQMNPSYRSHIHYGAVGALFAGKGGVEFDGALSYTSSPHTTLATCQDCHMAEMTGASGGHTFFVIGNFKGCNTAACHGTAPLDAKSPKFVDTRATVKKSLEDLAAALVVSADNIEILHKNKDAETNLWAGTTSKGYDGYLDIFDPSTNPDGKLQNPAPASSWAQSAKDTNAALPTFTLTNAQMGAIINFQMCLREYSLGIHNTAYSKALLANSLAKL